MDVPSPPKSIARDNPPQRIGTNSMDLTSLLIFLAIGAVAGWLAGTIMTR